MADDKPTTSLRTTKGAKLIPRDISEGLGKLPPQALDMEEAVLGAIMIESAALPKVESFLKADHFYVEAHREIFRACMSLKRNGSPVDMRTVKDQLKRDGKLELIGGQFYIVELSTKVSSGANVEYHARVVMEASIKRSIILAASGMHHDGYEDGTDPFDLLKKTIADLQHLHDTSTLENNEDRIKKLWADRLITKEPPAEVPLITIGNAVIATLGNHSLITGKKKARKTLFVVWLIHKYFTQNTRTATPHDIIIFDTEQGKSHVWQMRKKVKTLTGIDIPVFFLRGMAPVERRGFISDTLKYWPKKPKIVFIDGVRDLMSNINDPIESTDVIVWLEDLITTYNPHVCEILHQNKGDVNPRGHIGTELQNKAQVTIDLSKDEKTGDTVVKCESARDLEFDTFTFTHDPQGLPIVTDSPIIAGGAQVIPPNEKKKRLLAIFKDEALGFSYKELYEEVRKEYGISKNKAETLIREFQRCGWIIRVGKPRDPTALYKCITSDNGHHHNEPVTAAPQGDLFASNGVDDSVETPSAPELSDDLPF